MKGLGVLYLEYYLFGIVCFCLDLFRKLKNVDFEDQNVINGTYFVPTLTKPKQNSPL